MENQPDSQQVDDQIYTQQQDSQPFLTDSQEKQQDSQTCLTESQQKSDSQPIAVDDDEETSEEECIDSDEEDEVKFDESAEFKEVQQKLAQGDHTLCFGAVLCLIPFMELNLRLDRLISTIEIYQRKKADINYQTRAALRKNKMVLAHLKAFICHVQKHDTNKSNYIYVNFIFVETSP
jgi:hypothetical protein